MHREHSIKIRAGSFRVATVCKVCSEASHLQGSQDSVVIQSPEVNQWPKASFNPQEGKTKPWTVWKPQGEKNNNPDYPRSSVWIWQSANMPPETSCLRNKHTQQLLASSDSRSTWITAHGCCTANFFISSNLRPFRGKLNLISSEGDPQIINWINEMPRRNSCCRGRSLLQKFILKIKWN